MTPRPASASDSIERDNSSFSSSPPTSSSSRPSTSSHSSGNLPKPPPTGRVPPAKGRSLRSAGLRLGRKEKEREEEEWTLEDGTIARTSADGGREEVLISMDDSGLTEKPKGSKGKRLVHKTSQLFSRKEKGASNDSQSNLSIPSTSRQASFSSTTSGDSDRTNGSSKPFPISQRPQSHYSAAPAVPAPKRQHSRRTSQDPTSSWHGLPRPGRSGSNDPPNDPRLPIPRRQSSNLSASVPSLSRNVLPQPSLAPSSMTSRMSTWFTHLISNSTSPETVVAASSDPPSPARKPASAAANFLNAARQRAVDGVRNLLDTEAQPDKSTEIIWLLGLPHPGYQPGSPSHSPISPSGDLPDVRGGRRDSGASELSSPPPKSDALRPSAWPRRKDSSPGPMSPPNRSLGQLLSGSAISLGSPGKDSSSDSPGKKKPAVKTQEVLKWPDEFYNDFRTRIWCTYRGQYAPILPLPKTSLNPSPQMYYAAHEAVVATSLSLDPTESSLNSKPSSWGWAKAPEERGLTSDAGWGCMLRTGQSLLANALINLHLGRDWRVPETKPAYNPSDPSSIVEVQNYATYVRIISYFLDDPSPLCPFSVHRMALIGKELGKEVGEWFGPSTASGALKTLADGFPPCGLAVSTAADGTIYKSDVFAASSMSDGDWVVPGQKVHAENKGRWGHKAVLILVGLRLGLDGVNPIYHDVIKAIFTFPQSVGIAGGRPNTSYYFVASQGNQLYYLDPHFTRPAVALVVPPTGVNERNQPAFPEVESNRDESSQVHLDLVDVDELSDDSDNSLSLSKNRPKQNRHAKRLSMARSIPIRPTSPPITTLSNPSTPIASSSSRPADVFDAPTPVSKPKPISLAGGPSLDAQTAWYLDAYTESQLRTFHSEKVRKMPLSGLDPSMLLGFLMRDEADFEDFCERVANLPQQIFSVQEEPPTWDEDDAAGLESVSEPDLSDEDVASPTAIGEDEEEILAETETLTLESPIVSPIQPIPIPTIEDEEWVGGSSLPIAITQDRSDTPTSVPILIEKPSMEGIGKMAGGADDDEVLKEDMDEMADMGSPRRVAPGVRIMMRQRTDSWVKPDKPTDI